MRLKNCTYMVFVQLFGLQKGLFFVKNVILALVKVLRMKKRQCFFFTRIYPFFIEETPEKRE